MPVAINSNANSVLNGQSSLLSTQKRVADDYQTFIKLLTTQLQNQDPLEPLNANEFTQQLVQFASVEQQIAMNTNLESLIGMQAANTQISALNYLERDVTFVGSEGYLKEGSMRFRIATEKAPNSITISITDSNGNVVKTIKPSPSSAPIDINWDGKDNNGSPVADGRYKIKVSALDEEGAEMKVFTAVTGKVTSVRSGPNNEILLAIEDLLIDSANVIAIGKLTSTSPSQQPPA